MSIKGFPLPPNLNRGQMPMPPAPQAQTPSIGHSSPPAIPPAPPIKNEQGTLNENEVDTILRMTLKPVHREDPNVLRFIASYMSCRSTAQAAREAGLDTRSGNNLRQRSDIHACIEALTLKSVMKYGLDASEVVERAKEIAFIDPIEFENEDGTYKTSLSKVSPEARRAVKKFRAKNIYEIDPNGMKVCVGQMVEVEFWSKEKAIELIGRESNLFTEKKQVQHDVTNNMAAFLLDATKRADDRVMQLKDATPENQQQLNGHVAPTLSEEVIEDVDNGENA